ncbi:MAG TPA: hypothetical protein VIV35_08465 [Chitinophagaceae bacterium]
MEVHHHSVVPKKEKHFKHYLFDFLMLFLAVFCGFLAENQREHMVEHTRELQFMRSYISDLQKDVIQLDSLIKKREERKNQIDSLSFIFRSADPDLYGTQSYFYARYLPRPFIYIPNDATIQQLKSSGNLRLIRKQGVTDTILSYDQQFRFIETIRIREDQLILRIFNHINEFFDPAAFDQMNTLDIEFTRPSGNPKLLTRDKKLIQQFLSELQYLRTVNLGQLGWFKRRMERANKIVGYIKNQYHLH